MKEERDKGLIESGGSVNSGDRDMQGFRGAKLRRETRTATDGGSAGLVSSQIWLEPVPDGRLLREKKIVRIDEPTVLPASL